MKNKQLPLVNFEQAQRLKKVGFDWPTSGVFCGNLPTSDSGEVVMRPLQNHNGDNSNDNIIQIALVGYRICSAPTVALALKWMRDVKGQNAYVFYHTETNLWWLCNEMGTMYDTYEQAESALLDELLTLI